MTTLPAVVRVIDLPVATTITLGEVIEAVQTVGGVQISVQVPLSQVMTSTLGGLPTGGGTSQILAKASGTNFSAAWYDVTSFLSVNTASALVTSGTGTALVIGIPAGGITSTQIANNAVGTNQLASSLGIASSLSVGTLLTVGGTATFNGTAIFNSTTIFNGTTVFSGGLNVTGTSLLTGTFGVVGTAQFTGAFNIVGTTLVTGIVGVVGTSQFTGLVNVVGTTLVTGTFGQVGTATFTANAFNVVGTASFTSGAFSVNGTTLFTSARFGVVGTSQFTGTFGIVGTTLITGTLGLSSLTAGVLVASSTGVISNQGGMVLLNTLSPNGVASTNDTTSFSSTYSNYLILFDDIAPATNTTYLRLQVATSGSNWIVAGYNGACTAPGLGSSTDATSFILTPTSATTSAANDSTNAMCGFVYLHNPSRNASVSRKTISGGMSYLTAAGGFANALPGGNAGANATQAVTGINILFSAGNIATGTIRIYGLT